jgi:hypothetical protein
MKPRPSKLDAVADQLAAWFAAENLSLTAARARLVEQHGLTVSIGALSRFWNRHEQARMREQLLARVATGAQLGRELEARYARQDAPTLLTLVKLARTLVLQLAVADQADRPTLKLAKDFLDTALKHADLERRNAELALSETKFQRETCELFLKWSSDNRAREIAESPRSNAEKIEALGETMFGDLWRK